MTLVDKILGKKEDSKPICLGCGREIDVNNVPGMNLTIVNGKKFHTFGCMKNYLGVESEPK